MQLSMDSTRPSRGYASRNSGIRRRPASREGFTLVELLVAMAVTLLLILALSQAFALVGDVVSKGRAAIEMSGTLRNAANRLQEDLDGLTVAARPWADERSGPGYLEIVDGPSHDSDWNDDNTWATRLADTDPALGDTTYGDIDDVIAFTSTSRGMPYVGEVAGVALQSTSAEIVWWIQYQDAPDNATGDGAYTYNAGEPFAIYRRAMLIRPDLGLVFDHWGSAAYANTNTGLTQLRNDLVDFFNSNDLSVRIEWMLDASGINVRLWANSLADLTRRENRFAHMRILSDRASAAPLLSLPPVGADANWYALAAPAFPHPIDLNRRSITSLYRAPKIGVNAGEDVMLTDALAFDVRVFDPRAIIRSYQHSAGPPPVNEAIAPGDPAYFNGFTPPINAWSPQSPPTNTIGLGAFVDLGYGHGNAASAIARLRYDTSGVASSSDFSGAPHARSGLNATAVNFRTPTYTYCTWSMQYERNGVDEDGDGVADEGFDGFDNDNNNGVDDPGERETSPPYPLPLRGVQVTIRAYEPDSRQVRQVSVTADFIPE